MKKEFVITSASELPPVAKSFLEMNPVPGTFLLKGAMGAGKTTFIDAVCRILGTEKVSSPTFSLINEYKTASGRVVFHADLYRVKSLEEALGFGFEEYLSRDAYFFIEWPDIVAPILKGYPEITIAEIDGKRIISF